GDSGEQKDGGDSILIDVEPNVRTARAGERHRPSFVGANQGSLGRRHRHEENPVRVLAAHLQGSGHAERHLHRADRILDLAAHLLRREAERSDMPEGGAGFLLDPAAPRDDRFRGIAKLVETRNEIGHGGFSLGWLRLSRDVTSRDALRNGRDSTRKIGKPHAERWFRAIFISIVAIRFIFAILEARPAEDEGSPPALGKVATPGRYGTAVCAQWPNWPSSGWK